jgi:hypothetical protein
MVENPRRHAAYQRFAQIEDMERTPDLKRAQHFLDGQMTQADRLARQVKELKTGDIDLTKRLVAHSRRVERLRASLEHLHEKRGDDPRRSPAAVRRRVPEAVHHWSEA